MHSTAFERPLHIHVVKSASRTNVSPHTKKTSDFSSSKLYAFRKGVRKSVVAETPTPSRCVAGAKVGSQRRLSPSRSRAGTKPDFAEKGATLTHSRLLIISILCTFETQRRPPHVQGEGRPLIPQKPSRYSFSSSMYAPSSNSSFVTF